MAKLEQIYVFDPQSPKLGPLGLASNGSNFGFKINPNEIAFDLGQIGSSG